MRKTIQMVSGLVVDWESDKSRSFVKRRSQKRMRVEAKREMEHAFDSEVPYRHAPRPKPERKLANWNTRFRKMFGIPVSKDGKFLILMGNRRMQDGLALLG